MENNIKSKIFDGSNFADDETELETTFIINEICLNIENGTNCILRNQEQIH